MKATSFTAGTAGVAGTADAAADADAAREQWRALASRVLVRSGRPADGDPEVVLSSRTYDDIVIAPLYTATSSVPADPGQPPFVRGASSTRVGWDVRQRQHGSDAETVNSQLLDDISGGVTSVWLTCPAEVDRKWLDTALRDVDLATVGVILSADDTQAMGRALFEVADGRGHQRSLLHGSLGADPVATQFRTGRPADLKELASLTALVQGTGIVPVTVDGLAYHEAGASDGDEIAATTAAGVEIIRALASAGVQDPFDQLEFRFAVTADQFAGIAKLRAARLVWSRIAELSGTVAAQRQHAVTSPAMLTRQDSWLNIVRATIACFAAAVGGAEAITVTEFDAAVGVSEGAGRRLARNTHAVLHDESALGRVTDPAGGSFYVESLTEQLAQVAWHKFTALERGGGALAAITSGALAELIEHSMTRHQRAITTLTDRIVGVSAYPDVATPALQPALGEVVGASTFRWSAGFESLRQRLTSWQHRTGLPARVGIVLLGGGDRSGETLLKQALAIAGITTIQPIDVDTADASLAGWVLFLCGSDDSYAETGTAVIDRMRGFGSARLLVVGKPSLNLAVEDYLYRGCDVERVLSGLLDALGVPT